MAYGPSLEVITIAPGDVIVPPRKRIVDPEYVDVLAASFRESGMLQAIITRWDENRNPVLVAGAHRLEAAKQCGFNEITAIARDLSEIEAELIEIDENLMRHELTQLDRAVALAARKKVYETLHPETKQGGDRKSAAAVENQKDKLSFRSDAAERIGISDRTVARAIRIAEGLDPAVIKRLTGTRLADNASELLALVKLDGKKQRAAVARLTRKKDPASSVRAAIAEVDGRKTDVTIVWEMQFRKLCDLWARSSAKARSEFLAHIESGVAKPHSSNDEAN